MVPPARCPAEDFPSFLRAFEESGEVQRAFTRSPLTERHLDKMALPEPAPVEGARPRDQVQYPVFPGREVRRQHGLTTRLEVRSPGRADVVLRQQDTGYQVVYTFERATCWELMRIDDQSM